MLRAFTKQTGITVKVLKDGDAGAALNQAILTKDNPLGDAFFGIDNTFLSRALAAGIFVPYTALGLDRVPKALQLDPRNRVTPVDYGDVCVNYDKHWFASNHVAVPTTLEDLADPALRGKLVVENPATSSPGLAFVLASVAKFGSNGWQDYWKRLRSNDVKVDDGWEQAYDTDFSGSSGHGAYPLVVSYASSPPAEVYYAKPTPTSAPTGTLTDTCFRQVEFAGVLKGAAHPTRGAGADRLHAVGAVPGGHPAADVRLPVPLGHAAAAGLHEVRDGPEPPVHAPGGADRRQARRVDLAVDEHRPAVTAPAAGTQSLAARLSRGRSRLLVVGVPVVFLGVFFVWPVVRIIGRGLVPDGRLDLDPLGQVLTDPGLRHVAWFTVWQAALSTLLTLAIGLPGAYVLSRYRFRGRVLVRALVTVPFVLPTIVVGAAFSALGITGSLGAILLAHVFFNYAVVVRTVGGLWSHLDPRPEEAAQMLGANRWRTFVGVTLPALRPAVVAAGSIVFLFCFTSFGVILVLGGPRYATLETEIYRQTAQLLDLPVAAALAVVQLAAVLAALSVGGWARGRRSAALGLRAASEAGARLRTTGSRAFLATNLVVMAALLGVPISVLVLRSFEHGLDAYRQLTQVSSGFLEPPIRAVWTSLRYASIATVLALVVGGTAAFALAGAHRARRRSAWLLDLLVMLPLGVSAVTVGFGFLIALDAPPLDLRTSPAIIPIAHALIAIPFVVRVMLPVLQSIDPRLREAAAVLGAGPRRVWLEVDLRIAARAALVAAGFAFAISLGEFGATLFIVRPETTTLPVAIYRLLGRPGAASFDQAMAASTILMALTAVSVLVIERLRVRDVGEF